ncbi:MULTISPECIES: PAS domain S-box protein [unclassified Haladaptatus]|uniref:PAS domain-containing sensor histidine kinase n=1 Tax=unclassified Haladaptatus TaxID=2622732 RepID=UPI0023E75AC4|nr:MULTISPECIES: PAS domain S-box protein [unclassified Haladaptatus]
MSFAVALRRVKQWSVALLGGLLAALSSGLLYSEHSSLSALEHVLPLFLAMGLVGFGWWLVQSRLSPAKVASIALWVVAGIGVLFVVSLWSGYHNLTSGISTAEILEQALVNVTVGGLSGAAIGFLDVRRAEHRERAVRTEQAVDATMDGVAVLDEHHRFQSANQSFLDIYGFESADQLCGHSYLELELTVETDRLEEEVKPAVQQTGGWRGELTGVRCDGTTFPKELTVNQLDDGGLAVVIRDITEKHESQRALREERARFRALTENAPVGVVTLDEDNVIQFANQQLAEMLGYDAVELVGEPMATLIPDRFRPAHKAGVNRYLNTGEQHLDWSALELAGLHRDGHEVPLSVSFGETTFDGQHLFTGILIDISERKEREQRLDLQAAAIENALDGIAIIDPDGEYVYLNAAHARLYGFDDPEALVGASWRTHYDSTELKRVESTVFPALQSIGHWNGETHATKRDGSKFTQELSLNALADGHLVCTARDVTERRLEEIRLNLLQEATLDLGTERDLSSVIESAVEISQSIMDYSLAIYWTYDEERDSLVPTHASDAAHQMFEDADMVIDNLVVTPGMQQMDAFENGEMQVVENYQDFPAARRFPLPLTSAVYVPLGSHGLLGLGSLERQTVSQTSRYLVSILSRSVENALERISREETIEALHADMRTMVATTEVQEVAEIAIETARNVLGFPLCTLWLADETGTRLEPVAWTDESAELFSEMPTFTADGESLSWQAFESGTPFTIADVQATEGRYNPNTKIRSELILPLGSAGVLNIGSLVPGDFDETDVSIARLLAANTEAALKEARFEADLQEQNDRLEFLNSLLRHDILNGMVVIQSRATYLRDRLEGEEKRHAETIERWSDNIIELVQHVRVMLDLFAGRGVEFHPVSLSDILERQVDRIRSAYPEIGFDVDIDEAVTVEANALLAEVLGNVITNAVEHNRTENPHIDVSLTTDGETATVRVGDNGVGVPDDLKDHIFRRDETGHVKSAGSGFGLFFVDTMVDQYGGTVHIEDNDPSGAVFVITLPLA